MKPWVCASFGRHNSVTETVSALFKVISLGYYLKFCLETWIAGQFHKAHYRYDFILLSGMI